MTSSPRDHVPQIECQLDRQQSRGALSDRMVRQPGRFGQMPVEDEAKVAGAAQPLHFLCQRGPQARVTNTRDGVVQQVAFA
ncbi:hypothetical protein IN07_07485 [Modestobacter caceresii]|uniref:Uncharacterized protein n=1 Tax=Modestobacter caceresii TaxID=1522368 RepID=A0A098YCG0_9ACTN|nr:hypothetical protein IN07_07485 [Modestobacter caceresii]